MRFISLQELDVDDLRGFVVVAAAFMVQLSIWGVRAAISAFTHAIDRDPFICSSCYSRYNVTAGLLHDPLSFSTTTATTTTTDLLTRVYECCDDRHVVATAAGISSGLGPICGMLAGYLSGRFGARIITFSSAVCVGLSLVLSSYARSELTFLVAYGPLMGIGSGFMVTPGAFAVGTRFMRLLPLAMGVLYAGGGVGNAVVPRIAGWMLTEMGSEQWRAVQRWLTLSTVVCAVMSLWVRERRPGGKAAPAPTNPTVVTTTPPPVSSSSSSFTSSALGLPLASEETGLLQQQSDRAGVEGSHSSIETAAAPAAAAAGGGAGGGGGGGGGGGADGDHHGLVRRLICSPAYGVSFACAVLYGYSYYAALFCLIPFARAHGDPTSRAYSHYNQITLNEASTVLLAFGMAQCAGSIVLGFVSTKVNAYLMNLLCSIFSAIALAALPSCHSATLIGALAALLGVGSAGCRLCFPSMVTDMFRGPALGSLIGATLAGYGVGALPAPPASSAITTAHGGDYSIAFYLMSATVLFSGLGAFIVMGRYAPPSTPSVDSKVDAPFQESL